MKKHIRILTTALLLFVMTVQCVFAETVTLDVFTGNTYTAAGTSSDTIFTSGYSYNKRRGMYVYSVGTGQDDYISANVAAGEITNRVVSVEAGPNVEMSVSRDGERLDDASLNRLTEPGSYRVFYTGNQGRETAVFDFRIVGEATSLEFYTVPDIFYVTAAYKDDKSIEFVSQGVDFPEEGNYRVEYYCRLTSMSYVFEAYADRTPPVLALEAVGEDGVAHGPVDISDMERGIEYSIIKDGQPAEYTEVLKDKGEYEITLSDDAGNKTYYKFTIGMYFDVNAWVFIGIMAAVIIAVAVIMIKTRKSYKVR